MKNYNTLKSLSIFNINHNKLVKTTFLTYKNVTEYKGIVTSLEGELFYNFLPFYDDIYDNNYEDSDIYEDYYVNRHIPLDVKETLKKFNTPKIDISKIKDFNEYFDKKYGAFIYGYEVTTDGVFSLYVDTNKDFGEELFLDAYELKKGIVLEEIKKFLGIENPEIKIWWDYDEVYSLDKKQEEDNIASYIFNKL